MQKNNKRVWDTRVLVFLGLLVAMQIVLTRLFVIELGSYRITLGSVCSILAGLWFGPVGGGLCGMVADILGGMLKGYALNPLITLAAMMWGIVPAIFRILFAGNGTRLRKTVVICIGIFFGSVLGTLVLNTAAVALINGGDFWVSCMAIFPGRVAQWAIMTPIYCVLSCMMYFSPITKIVLGGMVQKKDKTAKA